MTVLTILCLTYHLIYVLAIDYVSPIIVKGQNLGLYGYRNDSIYSPDGNTKITMYYYGTLVLSTRSSSNDPWINQWQSNTCVDYVASCCKPSMAMQTDGNLVIYADHPVYINSGTCGAPSWWVSNTYSSGATTFVVHNDGYAYWMTPTQNIKWSTPTTPPNPPTQDPIAISPAYAPTQSPNAISVISVSPKVQLHRFPCFCVARYPYTTCY